MWFDLNVFNLYIIQTYCLQVFRLLNYLRYIGFLLDVTEGDIRNSHISHRLWYTLKISYFSGDLYIIQWFMHDRICCKYLD